MAAKKKKRVMRRAIHKKHKKKSNAKKTKVKIRNNQAQQIEQKINENAAADIENRSDYGSGEFGNVRNIEDRGEVIYGDEDQNNNANQKFAVKSSTGEGNIQEDNIQKDNIQESNVRESNIQESKAILNDKEFIIEKIQTELPPIPKVSSKKDKPIKPAISQFTGKKLMSEKDIAMDFAIKAHKKFDR